MLPGKASRLPVPIETRIRDVANATPTPYTGPKITPDKTLTICCMGKHLAAPTGIKNPDNDTASAINRPAKDNFLMFI
jgi:hypothetical protein